MIPFQSFRYLNVYNTYLRHSRDIILCFTCDKLHATAIKQQQKNQETNGSSIARFFYIAIDKM